MKSNKTEYYLTEIKKYHDYFKQHKQPVNIKDPAYDTLQLKICRGIIVNRIMADNFIDNTLQFSDLKKIRKIQYIKKCDSIQ